MELLLGLALVVVVLDALRIVWRGPVADQREESLERVRTKAR
jgi:hypothetical protein